MKKLITTAVAALLLVTLFSAAVFAVTGYGAVKMEVDLSPDGVNTQIKADPATAISTRDGYYGISYLSTFPTAIFDIKFTLSPEFLSYIINLTDAPLIRWDIYPSAGGSPVEGGVLDLRDFIDSSYTVKADKLGAPDKYTVNALIYVLDDEFQFEIEVARPTPATKPDVVAYKKDENGKPLPGATITMTGVNNNNVPYTYSKVTDNNGQAKFEGLEYGSYTLSETAPPTGYGPSNDIYEVWYRESGAYFYKGNPDALEPYEPVTFINRKITAPTKTFTAIKKDGDNGTLAGATLRLKGYNDDGEAREYKAVSDAEGIALFEAEYGEYILSEFSAPDGYDASGKSFKIRITANGVYLVDNIEEWEPYEPVTFINEKKADSSTDTGNTSGTNAGRVTALKKDDNGAPLAGATLRMEGSNKSGEPRGYNSISNNRGSAEFTVEYGDYTLSEYAAPAGYNATDDKYNIRVNSNGVFLIEADGKLKAYSPVTFVNRKIPVLNKDDHFAYMQGYPDGTFGPDLNMTRAEAVVMFSRLLNESMDLDTDYINSYYPDVPANEWYANQVCYMQRLGVLAFYSRDERFRPDEPVTRAEFATLAAHFDNLALTDANRFSDVADAHWAVKFINSAAAKGWIIGYENGTFMPEANITRAEVVTLVNRILERSADKIYLEANSASLPRRYTDVANGDWAYLMIYEASLGHDFIKENSDESWTKVYN